MPELKDLCVCGHAHEKHAPRSGVCASCWPDGVVLDWTDPRAKCTGFQNMEGHPEVAARD